VQDHAAALLFHPRRDFPAGAHARHHVDLEGSAPAFFVVAGAEAGSVVDEHIDAPERRACGLEEGVELDRLRDVRRLRVHLHTRRSELSRGRLERLGAARADRDVRALRGEAERSGAADATAATGDHYDLVQKP
jgi:hypothetical protein